MTKTNLPQWQQTLKESYPKFQAINPNKAVMELGFANQIFKNNTSLQKCEPASILNAVVNVARTSITLNPVMKLAYLIPRKNKCVLEFSYMGLIAMLRDNNCIKSISAHIVYGDEEFEHNVADNSIIHKPTYAKTEQEHNTREVIGCYSRATLPNGEVMFEFMPNWEIEKVKRMSDGSSSKWSPWNTWKDEMIKKSVIKRHFKTLISVNTSEQIQAALMIENENNQLITNVSRKNTLANTFGDVELPNDSQLSLLEESPSEPVKTPVNDMSEEEMSMVFEEEARKSKEQQTKLNKEFLSDEIAEEDDEIVDDPEAFINEMIKDEEKESE